MTTPRLWYPHGHDRVAAERLPIELAAPRVVVIRGPFGAGEGALDLLDTAGPGAPLLLIVGSLTGGGTALLSLPERAGCRVVPCAVSGIFAEDLAEVLGCAVFDASSLPTSLDGLLVSVDAARLVVNGLQIDVSADRVAALHGRIGSVAASIATGDDASRQEAAERLATLTGQPPKPVEPPPPPVASPPPPEPEGPVRRTLGGARALPPPEPEEEPAPKPKAREPEPVGPQTFPQLDDQGRGVSPAILLREAARASRQWRTYASRVGFSGVLMAIVLVAIGAGTQLVSYAGAPDPADFGSMGRNLFIGFAAVQTLVAMVVAPLVTARAVIEEREERTLELVVLSKITPRQILYAKIASSLLLLSTLVIGAMPVLSLVTSMGGVSIFEVMAATADAVAALVVLGVLGAFFALFTRSQVLAAVGAWMFALPAFVLAPWLLVAALAEPAAATWISPLYGTAARSGFALLPLLAYLPLVVRVLRIGSNVFAMRVSAASFGRLFAAPVWRTRMWALEAAGLGVAAFSVLPVAIFTAWAVWGARSQSGVFISADVDWWISLFAGLIVWAWASFALSSLGFIYLRLGAEWIHAIEALLLPTPGTRRGAKGKRAPPPAIGWNPILWHEARMKSFASLSLGLLAWILAMWAAFQSMLWVIPGGLLAIGIVNAVVGWFVAAWLAVGTFERERHDGTLELLLTSTLNAMHVVVGKAIGAAIPSLPMVVLAVPLLVVGVPHASLITFFDGNGIDWGSAEMLFRAARGGAVGVWALSVWALALSLGLVGAVRMRNPRHAYGLTFGVLGAILLLPWMASVVFGWWEPMAVISRVFLPFLGIDALWWEPLIPAAVFFAVAFGLFLGVSLRLRQWTARVLA